MIAPVTALDGALLALLLLVLAFLGSRVAHAVALSRTSKGSSGRFWGTAGSWLVIGALAVWDLIAFLRVGVRF